MALDPVLGCELLSEGTTQAEPLVNEMLARILSALCKVTSKGDTAPPGSPVNFDSYIIGTGATGVWSGKDGKIGVYVDGWKYMTPTEGMVVRVNDDNYHVEYDGAAWVAAGGGFQTLVDAATIAWDTSLGKVAKVTLGGNRTMGLPTNLVDGETYILHVIQDATPPRTLAWNAAFHWPAATAPTLTNSANKIDVFAFQARGGVLYGSTVGLNYT